MTDDELPPTPWRRRALLLLLAVAITLVVLWALIYRPGDPKRGLPRAAAAASAVGGKADVRLLPAPSAPR